MKIFVWRGTDVLRNYSSGIAVVAADSVEAAWAKMRKDSFKAWYWLQYGQSHIYDEEEAARETAEDIADYAKWLVPQPEEFSIEDLPVLVKEGGE